MNAIVFFCPVCYKSRMISVLEHGRTYPPEITNDWIDLIQSGYATRTMPIEEAKMAQMCYDDHETES